MIARSTDTKNGTHKLRPLCVATLAAWLLPGAALAQFALEEPTKPPVDPDKVAALTQVSSEIEGGLLYISDPSFKFGEYSGLTDDGVYGILNVGIHKRNPYDSGNANYLDFTGRNIGLDSRELHFEMGEQGNYKLFLDYNQIPKNRSDSGETIFQGVGSNNLTLPAGWTLRGGGQNTAGLPSIDAALHPVDIETERKRFDVGMGKVIDKNWNFKLKYRHEEKEGTKTIGGVMGNSGGNPRSVILPEPVDYTTEQVDAVLAYTDKKVQFEVAYYMSLFRDGNRSLTWQNPYGPINGWDASAGFPWGQGSLSTPPDNEFHQISVLGGYNFSDTTRVSADLALGKMTQDETYLPYTVNPTLAASITQPLPQESLDGEIETTLFNLRINSRPSANFYWNASYRYDDRDNKTHHNEYVYIGGDTTTQDTSATSSRRRFNEPYSRTDHIYRVDAGYKVAPRTDLTGGLERQDIDRTYTEREEATDDTIRLGLKSRFGNGVTGGVRVQRSERDGSTYHGDEPFLSSYAPAYTATVPGMWENHPDLRKFYQADRTRDKGTIFANFMPAPQWSFGFSANYLNDDYSESEKGLTESKISSVNLDATFMPMDGTSIYGFFTHEKMSAMQDGRAFRGGGAKLDQAADPGNDWTADHDDKVDTFGLGFKHVVNERWDVGGDFVYAKTKSDVDVTTGPNLSSEPLPTSTTRLNSLNLYAAYKWKKNLTLKVHYIYEDYKSEDWAVDGVDPNTLANVILLGEESPDYTVHGIGVSVSYRYY